MDPTDVFTLDILRDYLVVGAALFALGLLGFGAAVAAVLETWSPHKLCAYLFDVAGRFTTFFENCPVLQSDDATRASTPGRFTSP